MAVSGTSELDAIEGTLLDGGTLPSSWYVHDAVLDWERDAIFRKSWLYVGHTGQLSNSGDHFAAEVADVPVVILRDRDDQLRGFVNICCHRAHQVVQGCGNRGTLQCIYHGWTYNLDGTLRAAPRSDREPDFDPSRYALRPVQVEAWGPLLFVNIDLEADPLGSLLGELPALMREQDFVVEPGRYQYTRRWHLPCNWKVFVDNAVECYHCPTCHPTFKQQFNVDPDVYKLEIGENWIRHLTSLRRPDGDRQPSMSDAQFHHIFPNIFLTMMKGAPGGEYQASELRPVTPGSTELVMHVFSSEDLSTTEIARRMDEHDVTLEEDLEICERVQRAHASGMAPSGHLMPASENTVQHFQWQVWRALARSADRVT